MVGYILLLVEENKKRLFYIQVVNSLNDKNYIKGILFYDTIQKKRIDQSVDFLYLHRLFFAFSEVRMEEDSSEDHAKIIYKEKAHKL